MLYKWKLVFELTSGKTLTGIYEGEETYSDAVAKIFLDGEMNQYIGLQGIHKTNLFVKRGDISALDISIY